MKYLLNLPDGLILSLFRDTLNILKRGNSITCAGYSLEDVHRFKWRSLKDSDVESDLLDGDDSRTTATGSRQVEA